MIAAGGQSRHDPDLLQARAEAILTRLCTCGGSMCISVLGDTNTFFNQDPVKFLSQFPFFFRLEHNDNTSDSECLVHAYTRAQLCTAFDGKEESCSNPRCESLHLCKYFVTGSCQHGNKCRSSHHLRSPHNQQVLGIHHLTLLDDKIVQLMLKQSLVEITVPDLCSHYNSTRGCSKDMKCPFVHVCRHYVIGDCRFNQGCRYSHNLLDQQPIKVLTKFNIDINQSPQALVKILEYKINSGNSSSTSASGGAAAPFEKEFANLKTSDAQTKISGHQRKRHSSSMSAQPDDVFVCVFHLRDKCNYADKCHNVHTEEPFQWQYLEASRNQWSNFPKSINKQIEESFCKVDNEGTKVEGQGLDGWIDFEKMSLKDIGGLTTVEIKRIGPHDSTPGWRKVYATRWLWYWNDETGKWIEYGKQNVTRMKSDINSSSLEDAYQKYLNKENSRHVDFQTGSHEYRLDLEQKTQRNIRYTTERPIRRRPMLVSTKELNDRAERFDSQYGVALPDHWDIYAKSTDTHSNFQRCLLIRETEEYNKVHRRFDETISTTRYTIQSIERVQNMDLWEDFSRKKDRMVKNSNGQKIREELLFHGTDHDAVKAICQQNFDSRLSGTRVGHMYGQGSYFHKSANYSNKYSTRDGHQNKFMFVAKVLVGSFTTGSATLRRPPPKNPKEPLGDLYDTCVDNQRDPSIFVVFENNQVYPEYIIKYM